MTTKLRVMQAVLAAPFGPLAPGYHVITYDFIDGDGNPVIGKGAQFYIPTDYDPAVAHKTVLALNGTGENGGNNTSQVGVGVGPAISDGADAKDWVVIFPQCPSGLGDDASGAITAFNNALAALRAVQAIVNTDTLRIGVTGISSGGTHSWGQIYNTTGIFAWAAPIAAFIVGTRILQQNGVTNLQGRTAAVARFTTFPIRVYNGTNDPGPLPSAQADAAAFAAAPVPNPNFLFTQIIGADHGQTWYTTYGSAGKIDGGAIATAFWAWASAQHL